MASVEYSYGKLTDSFTVIVVDNDTVKIKLQLKNELFPITIVCIPTLNPETNASGLNWRTENGVVHFTFYGWTNSLGTTTEQVNTNIGTTNAGEPIYVVVSHHKVAHANHLTMQLVLGHGDAK